MSFGGSQWCRSTPDLEHRSTGTPKHRSTTPTESPASCNAVKILTHEEFAAKHPHPPSPDKVRIARRADTSIDRHRESSIDRHSEAAIDRQPPVPIDRRTPITYRVLMPKIDVARLNALRPKSKPSEYPPEPVRTPSNDGEDPMEEDRVPTIRTLRRRKEKVAKHLKRGANDKEKECFRKRVFRIPIYKPFEDAYYTHRLWIFTDEELLNMQKRDGTDQIRAEADWERTRFSPPIDRAICPSINTHHQQSIDNNNATSIAKRPIPNTTVSERDKFDHQFLTPDEFGIFRDPDGYAKAMDGRTLHVSREDIADILQTANEADNLFMHHRINPEQKATNEFYDTAGGIDNNFIQNFAIQLKHRSTKFYWEEKDEYGVYRDDRRYARDLDGNTIRLHNTDIRRVLERASRDEPSYICLHEHANLFTQTKLVPEIYTKDKINEMFYGVCGEHEKNKEAFQMKLDGVYYPLNDSISWFTTCMEEMKQNIAIIQHATDVARPPSIDRRRPPSIDNPMPSSIDDSPPRPHMKKSQKDFHTREEIYQLVEEIYRALETTEERLDGRCDDIYFPMHLSISALTSKIEALQKELVEIQSYIARRPEASLSIDRSTNISTDIHHQTSVDDTTNRGRLVPKMTSDMSDTHYYGEEISAATYATLRRHQFNLENLEERLQRMENPTVTMKEKWRRGDEAIREFTDSTKDTKVDQPVNYPLLLRLF
ncbi:hypothetical protein F2Q70_00038366 [Brassica cretica]|uniref:Uncharacterized protein n=1 Tax=Brassica cretica TaxID=69181 RepID=A0A8S9K9S3_BRACR|nr:hypothetical protein F2Q70_00038366 [Brassica cretica]